MTDWLISAVPVFKFVHIAALAIWCGGLLALPLMLLRHDRAVSPDEYQLIVRATHLTYTMCVTPAAVITVIAGTWLIFLKEVFTPWLFAKLAFVSLLVLAHAWVGFTVVRVLEKPKEKSPPAGFVQLASIMVPALAIFYLVLAKPDLSGIAFPSWLMEPRGGQLLFDVPSR